MTAVEIAGIGLHPFGRFEGKTVTEMGVAAVRQALADAGVDRRGFQAAFCGTAYSGVAAGHRVLDAIGATGGPIVDVEAGCASGGAALMMAAGAIAAGQYDTALVFGMEKMPKGIIRSSFFAPWQEEAGLAATPAYFALRAQRLMRESGVTRNHLADVVVKNRANGVHNPDARVARRVRAAAPLDAVLAERRRRCRRTARRARLRKGRAPGGGRPAVAPSGERAERGHADVGPGRRRRTRGDHARRAGCLRRGRLGAVGPRRGRVPGHRRGARAAVV
ncbi:MAG: hypothetical protein E6G57_17280 [Actinobacteria bacterium]|nr:MAG: hypothetical protein E6G57_17280 [Actinomycetota bacterium]